MNQSVVLSLATVLFKSYFRSSRPGKRSPFSNPVVVLVLDIVLFACPFVLVLYFLSIIPVELMSFLHALLAQAIIGLPVILTSAVILAGILFELGQSGGLASSEAVNWLPVSPREYVAASSVSVDFAYSPFLFLGLGAVLPFAISFGMVQVVPFVVVLSALAFFWGAVIVEVLRAVMNRISTTVYKRSGRLGIMLRLSLMVLLFVVVQLAFNPYILFFALSAIVSGVSLVWFVPMVWPSVAVASLLNLDVTRAITFMLLSVVFTFVIFEGATWLRAKYWSPVPVAISVSASTVYIPKDRSPLWLSPVGFAIASKDLKSLVRRKDMARFLAIPVLLLVTFLIPMVTGIEGTMTIGSGPGLFLIGEISCLLPIMLSSISIGQEGRSVVNIYMLPISATDFIRGKLFLPWIVSAASALTVTVFMQVLLPIGWLQFLTLLIAVGFTVIVDGYVGLAAGSRHPDFTLGPRARYITLVGILMAFIMGAVTTALIFLPLVVYLNTGFLGMAASGSLLVTFLTIAIATVLLVTMRSYCRRGVSRLLANMET